MATYAPTTEHGTCIFCDIVSKNDPSVIYWQNDAYAAFLSIDPNTLGFSLVVPKVHHGSDILRMPDTELQSFIVAAKHVAHILENYFDDVGRVGLIMEGTGIDHAHIKLVPMHGTGHMKRGEWKQYLSGVNHWFDRYEGWMSSAGGPMARSEDLIAMAQEIRASYTC
jgi:diadenosine tetraphosphate (Ap4A) HIT family hydrolase